jgi:hypothetical protein
VNCVTAPTATTQLPGGVTTSGGVTIAAEIDEGFLSYFFVSPELHMQTLFTSEFLAKASLDFKWARTTNGTKRAILLLPMQSTRKQVINYTLNEERWNSRGPRGNVQHHLLPIYDGCLFLVLAMTRF